MNTHSEDQSRSQPDSGESADAKQPRFDFEQLAQGSHEVLIEFRGQTYRLRLTRHDKLILNK
jgi:hemin uptake protein HemP